MCVGILGISLVYVGRGVGVFFCFGGYFVIVGVYGFMWC